MCYFPKQIEFYLQTVSERVPSKFWYKPTTQEAESFTIYIKLGYITQNINFYCIKPNVYN